MFRALAIAVVALSVSSAAMAAEVKPPVQEQTPGSVPVDPKQVVCKHVAASDQNMLPGAKVCHTRAEWAELDKQGGSGQSSANSGQN